MTKLPYLNLGCGATFHEAWTNIDFISNSEHVMAYNLINGIPKSDSSFEAVYHSHVLEHFPKSIAIEFLKECFRVLKPNGIIRIAIPDLEQIALNYINFLNDSMKGIAGAAEKYNWTLLELFDQMVRSKSGGEMIDYIKDTSKNNDAFLLERNGYEVKRIMDIFRNSETLTDSIPSSYSLYAKLKSISKKVKNKIVHLLLADDYPALQVGKFRSEGEIHQWMYDRYSLKLLLENIGFREVRVVTAFDSRIPEWENFNLDGTKGIVRKPDSLFVEALK